MRLMIDGEVILHGVYMVKLNPSVGGGYCALWDVELLNERDCGAKRIPDKVLNTFHDFQKDLVFQEIEEAKDFADEIYKKCQVVFDVFIVKIPNWSEYIESLEAFSFEEYNVNGTPLLLGLHHTWSWGKICYDIGVEHFAWDTFIEFPEVITDVRYSETKEINALEMMKRKASEIIFYGNRETFVVGFQLEDKREMYLTHYYREGKKFLLGCTWEIEKALYFEDEDEALEVLLQLDMNYPTNIIEVKASKSYLHPFAINTETPH